MNFQGWSDSVPAHRVFTAIVVIAGPFLKTASAEDHSAAVHPWVVYQPTDRQTIPPICIPAAATGSRKSPTKATVIRSSARVTGGPRRHTRRSSAASTSGKAQGPGDVPSGHDHLAGAVLEAAGPRLHSPPLDRRPRENATFAGIVRTAVQTIEVPKYRVRDYFPCNDDPQGKKGPGPWGRYLEGSIALWHYALAYDTAGQSRRGAGGLEPQVLDELYRRLADGAFHLMVRHLATYDWKAHRPSGKQLEQPRDGGRGHGLPGDERPLPPGAGRVAAASRLRGRPAPGSPPGPAIYLKGWDSSRDDARFPAYYYEGPHYLCYWAQYFLPFAPRTSGYSRRRPRPR